MSELSFLFDVIPRCIVMDSRMLMISMRYCCRMDKNTASKNGVVY